MNGWILETSQDYIAYNQGVYYKVNNALIYKIEKKEVVQRNTFTGKEKVLAENIGKTKALKLMRSYAKTDFQRL
jgi:hypothetical protein